MKKFEALKLFKDIYKVLVDLNTFSLQKFKSVKDANIDSTTVISVTHATVDELMLVSKSIGSKEYLNDKYIFLYLCESCIKCFYNILSFKRYEYR